LKSLTRQHGFTLVEVVVATTLLSVIGGGIFALWNTGVDNYGLGVTGAEVERRSNLVLQQIAEELSTAGRDVLYPQPLPPESSGKLTLQSNQGWSDGDVAWSTPTVIEFRYAADDPNDGKDNNGNGLIDEGIIVRRENAGTADEREIVLTRWVREYLEGEEPNGKDDNGNGLIDEPGLCFDVIGEVWTIRLTLERPDPRGRLVTHTVQTSIKTRN
jgi:prepilin-type N-terminal cleavage/methylation domain-containing protein